MKKFTVRYYNSIIVWLLENQLHRNLNLPSYYKFKNKRIKEVCYHHYDQFHRVNGPAIIDYEYKTKSYYYYGKTYNSLEELQILEACR